MKATGMLTGMGVGAAIGGAMVFTGSKLVGKSAMKSFRKSTARCMKSINNVLDGVSAMLK